MSVRTLEIREATHPISSAIANAYIDFSKMTCSLVAVVTDAIRDGSRVVGYGFNSNGGMDRVDWCGSDFAPRVLEAGPASLLDESGSNLDPDRIWATRRAIAVGGRATLWAATEPMIFLDLRH